MKLNLNIFCIVICCLFFTLNTNSHAEEKSDDIMKKREQVIDTIKKAEAYIKVNGKEKAIAEFKKNSNDIFAINYQGTSLVQPLYPHFVGTNQINYKDPFGILVVQEEIELAKSGGGWLKNGRWRKNPQTGQYDCRKSYILPLEGEYFIGSWYYYPADKPEDC